ncbi:MAG: hypothetical protein EXR60_06740 [Dehalococcoidia bacterium]|nr:hypothetical protein [Dehalococcoidia bacterium]
MAGSTATYLRGDALVYIVPALGPGPPWEYLVEAATLDSLLQADDTFVALVGAGAGDLWAVPAEEAAFLIEGRAPQVDAEGSQAWRFYLASQGRRWLLRAESSPAESIDATPFHNAPPGG